MNDIYEFVLNVLSETCDVDTKSVSPNTNIIEDLQVDSVDFLDAIYEIDKNYGIKVPVSNWIAEINEGKKDSSDYFIVEKFVEKIATLINQKIVEE